MTSFNDGFRAGIEAAAAKFSRYAAAMRGEGWTTLAESYDAIAADIRALAPAAPVVCERRKDPAPEPTEAEVERLALLLFDQHQQTHPHPITWDRAADIGKERFRQQARAALAAMGRV